MIEFACRPEGLAIFNRISGLLISGDRDLDNIMDAILLTTMGSMGAERAFIAMVDYEHGELAVRYPAGKGWNEPNTRLRLKVSQESGRGIPPWR